MKRITALDKARLIARLAAEKKGENIVLLDMRKVSAMYDWFVLVSASSSRRISTISSEIQEKLSKKRLFPLYMEGKNSAKWALLDYENVIVHIFYAETREFYDLERLWADAPKERFDEKCLKKTSRKK